MSEFHIKHDVNAGVVHIQNIRVLDPVHGSDEVRSVWIKHGQLIPEPTDLSTIEKTIDGTGKWLMPALVDLCARLREPGEQQHGTLKSEGQAARAAGFLHVAIPPDTKPVLESGALLPGFRQKAYDDGGIYLHVIGALTKGLEGQQPANLAGLKQGKCIAVSNARKPFANNEVLLRTLEYAETLGLTVFFYPEDTVLANDGCVHDGFMASRQGLAGIPAIAETVALSTQLLLVEATGVRAHFSQLSCAASVELIAAAKKKNLPVTADVAMHQLYLTDASIDGFNSAAHVRPPLRSFKDREGLRAGVASGVIDAICSHHEPLSATAKMMPFAETEAGISAFDSFMALGVGLVRDGVLSPLDLARRISKSPAEIAGIETMREAVGGWVVVDPTHQWTINAESIQSSGKNTPFLGAVLTGKVTEVVI
ncbi:MAG: aspartate carbamoyltransferase [Gammaproteobacteria bacterium]|nr:aspartate carbamoyltransferase [Gammaproteobacteria bacterium]